MTAAAKVVTRAEIEDFLYHEAALLDDWDLDGWLELYEPTPSTRCRAMTNSTPTPAAISCSSTTTTAACRPAWSG